jgi:serine protein kinase
MSIAKSLLSLVSESQNLAQFRELHWEGSFEAYLDLVAQQPQVTRSAFERIYDMILSYGVEPYRELKEPLTRYRFFADPVHDGADAIFGLDRPLMHLVQVFKSAAQRYGTEKRVLLLHGPVGSCKSTIVRLLKKGLEAYSKTEAGALYSFSWQQEDGTLFPCPMNEEPLHLVPAEFREVFLAQLNAGRADRERVHISGELCPACRFMYREALRASDGDWTRAMGRVRVRRIALSEQDRVGVGTFQPKDEKNQDATELTGDINYRKIAEFGSDSDPRAFNFDGEFNIANRGVIEFIEILKLDVAFLYELLGASQEHSIKPKKFAQTDIDEVLLGHSVAGGTPVPYRHGGVPGWTTLERLHERFGFQGIALCLKTVPGPELADNQCAEDELMPFRILDACLHLYAGEKLSPSEVAAALTSLFPDTPAEELERHARRFATLFTRSIYKWVQSPLSLHVGSLDLDRERALQLPVVQRTEWWDK